MSPTPCRAAVYKLNFFHTDRLRADCNMAMRTGTGGWTYAPWRGVFYPKGLRQADELHYASRRLGAIEINATYHAPQSPQSFARWAAQTPDTFQFTVKASRICTNRRVLAEAGEAVDRFLGHGLTELGDRLGPILWQFMPTKTFDPADFGAFLDRLPAVLGDRPLRHCVEVRHPSFEDPRFIDLCASRRVAICLVDSPKFPMIDAATADFAYVRLMRGEDAIETGYPPDRLDDWAERLRDLAGSGGATSRDVFAFFINQGKLRAPAAALALAERVAGGHRAPPVRS
jgi:uncharacterized protein YecE (DUF72 family)